LSVLCLFFVESILSLGCFSPVPDQRFWFASWSYPLVIWLVAVAGADPDQIRFISSVRVLADRVPAQDFCFGAGWSEQQQNLLLRLISRSGLHFLLPISKIAQQVCSKICCSSLTPVCAPVCFSSAVSLREPGRR
jgi:hypothetical protein